MRPAAALFVLFTSALLSACSFNHHGAFCGPGHPRDANASGLSQEQRLQRLRATAAQDDIDEACKAHDICWTEAGPSEANCDRELADRLDTLEFNPLCENVASDISGWFILFHPSRESNPGGTIGLRAGKIFASPLSLIGVGLHGLLQLQGRADRTDLCCALNLQNDSGPCAASPQSTTRGRIRSAILGSLPKQRRQLYDLFLAPGIPEQVRARTLDAVSAPRDLEPIGILRTSFFRSTTSALVFTEEGVYVKPRRSFARLVSYPTIREIVLDQAGGEAILIDNTRIEILGLDSSQVAHLLSAVANAAQ